MTLLRRKLKEFEILHGVLYLPSSYKRNRFTVSYKYAKILKDSIIFEVIQRPVVFSEHQWQLNRHLIIRENDWTGKAVEVNIIPLLYFDMTA